MDENGSTLDVRDPVYWQEPGADRWRARVIEVCDGNRYRIQIEKLRYMGEDASTRYADGSELERAQEWP